MHHESLMPRSGKGDEIPRDMLPSSHLGSSLAKTQQSETRIPEGKEWVKDLINEIPVPQLPVVTEFLKHVPPEQAEEAARDLFDVIKGMADGIMHSRDPKGTLDYCIKLVENRLKN